LCRHSAAIVGARADAWRWLRSWRGARPCLRTETALRPAIAGVWLAIAFDQHDRLQAEFRYCDDPLVRHGVLRALASFCFALTGRRTPALPINGKRSSRELSRSRNPDRNDVPPCAQLAGCRADATLRRIGRLHTRASSSQSRDWRRARLTARSGTALLSVWRVHRRRPALGWRCGAHQSLSRELPIRRPSCLISRCSRDRLT
jgi:hypothetical protein